MASKERRRRRKKGVMKCRLAKDDCYVNVGGLALIWRLRSGKKDCKCPCGKASWRIYFLSCAVLILLSNSPNKELMRLAQLNLKSLRS